MNRLCTWLFPDSLSLLFAGYSRRHVLMSCSNARWPRRLHSWLCFQRSSPSTLVCGTEEPLSSWPAETFCTGCPRFQHRWYVRPSTQSGAAPGGGLWTVDLLALTVDAALDRLFCHLRGEDEPLWGPLIPSSGAFQCAASNGLWHIFVYFESWQPFRGPFRC